MTALTLWIALLLALSPQAAHARAHVGHRAMAARGRLASVVSYNRAHGSRWASTAAYQRGRHSHAVAAVHSPRARKFAWRGRPLKRFASSMPAMRSPGAASSVVADALRFIGAGNVTGMPGAWCADYASMILRRTGHRPLAGRSVSAALAYGPRVRQPKPGDLVVINTRAGYAQHVGFFAGWDHGQMRMVSGNWGHRVQLSPISPGSVAAFIGI